jgi:hypothetical protein
MLAMESVAALPWNQWQASPGIGGMFGMEYAVHRRSPIWVFRMAAITWGMGLL